MDTVVRTLDKLQSLERLYRQGFRSEVIDRAIDKLLATEIKRAHAERRDLEARLADYEKRYNMSSEEFYRRFRAGELGDGMDFVEWSVFYEMYQAILERLEVLGVELYQEVIDMEQTGVTMTMEEIKTLVFRLPPLEFIRLADEMRGRAETFEMMCLAETGFAEWNEPGEDIYDYLADES